MEKISDGLMVENKLHNDGLLEFDILSGYSGNTNYLFLNEEEVIKLRNHLNTVIDSIK